MPELVGIDMSAQQEIVSRTISLVPGVQDRIERAIALLSGTAAISEAKVDSRGRLMIRYDAATIGLGGIERLLDQAGLARPRGLVWRCKAAWYRYLDANAKANADARSSACCNRPPSS